jgi:hypothetical protein
MCPSLMREARSGGVVPVRQGRVRPPRPANGDTIQNVRARTAWAWPSSPSKVASRAVSAMSSGVGDRSNLVRIARKWHTDKPQFDRALPPVSRVWLGPTP